MTLPLGNVPLGTETTTLDDPATALKLESMTSEAVIVPNLVSFELSNPEMELGTITRVPGV
jgi:hypothetical protein